MATTTQFEKSQYIIVNGNKVLLKDFLAAKRAAKKVKKVKNKCIVKNETQHKEITELQKDVEDLVKKVTPFKSLQVFYEHSYRSYGNVSEQLFKIIGREFTKFRSKYRDVEKILDTINDCAKKKETCAYDMLNQLAWKVDDMKLALNDLVNKVKETHPTIKHLYGNLPIYNGRMLGGNTPRELGFKHQIFCKSPLQVSKVMADLESAVKTLQTWAANGQDPLTYKI